MKYAESLKVLSILLDPYNYYCERNSDISVTTNNPYTYLFKSEFCII